MISHFKKIDKLSNIFFIMGLFFSKLHYFPLYFLSGLFNLVALSFYLLGYITWLTASFLHPDTAINDEEWYGFAQFKQQYSISALIGTVATVLTLATLFSQILILPSAWLFLVSNVFWCIAEYHKLKNPPAYGDYSHTQQTSYLNYCITSTSLSFFVAAMTTLTFCIPPTAIFTVPFSLLVGAGFSLVSFYYWRDYRFGKHEICSVSSFQAIGEYIELDEINQNPASRCSVDLPYTVLFAESPKMAASADEAVEPDEMHESSLSL